MSKKKESIMFIKIQNKIDNGIQKRVTLTHEKYGTGKSKNCN